MCNTILNLQSIELCRPTCILNYADVTNRSYTNASCTHMTAVRDALLHFKVYPYYYKLNFTNKTCHSLNTSQHFCFSLPHVMFASFSYEIPKHAVSL